MDERELQEEKELAASAVSGDREALESLLTGVHDAVFNLSLRMLGTICDAEDATQEILIKAMTRLASFRGESAFSTWVFRVAVNHLKDYRKGMFAGRPLSFEVYGEDIASGREKDVPDLSQGVDRDLLERELKLSCTNVMLQCLDAESRCVFILGAMFKADSRIAGEILGITPEAYRKRLSRVKAEMAAFLGKYCGLSGTGSCRCGRRVDYAVATRRLDPKRPEYASLAERKEKLAAFVNDMEHIDDLSTVFSTFPAYRATDAARRFLKDFLASDCYARVEKA